MTKSRLPVRYTGQHFTIDKALIEDAIIQSAIGTSDIVLDIGAGKGFITGHLTRKAGMVIAIENDARLVKHLQERFRQVLNIRVVGCDFRSFHITEPAFKVVSNIPYGITSQIFRMLMYHHAERFQGGSIILQLEPARKLFAKEIHNPYAIVYHTFFNLELLYEINPGSFLPPPTVQSAMLKIERKAGMVAFPQRVKYLHFVSFLLQKPDLPVRTAFKQLFRKSQLKEISEKHGIPMEPKVGCLSASQWEACFIEMLKMVPEKFHPASSVGSIIDSP